MTLISWVNNDTVLKDMNPAQVIVSLFIMYCLLRLARFLFYNCRYSKIKVAGFNFAAAYIPSVKAQIAGEMNKLKGEMTQKFAD